MCIGTGPIGVLMIGILSGQTGPSVAILIMASIGLCGLGLVWRKLTKGQPKQQQGARPDRPAHGVMC